MTPLFCSRILASIVVSIVSASYKYTRALASLEVSELFPPLPFLCALLFSRDFKTASYSSSYRAAAGYWSQRQRFLCSRTDAAVFFLSLTRYLEDAPLGFLLYSSVYLA